MARAQDHEHEREHEREHELEHEQLSSIIPSLHQPPILRGYIHTVIPSRSPFWE